MASDAGAPAAHVGVSLQTSANEDEQPVKLTLTVQPAGQIVLQLLDKLNCDDILAMVDGAHDDCEQCARAQLLTADARLAAAKSGTCYCTYQHCHVCWTVDVASHTDMGTACQACGAPELLSTSADAGIDELLLCEPAPQELPQWKLSALAARHNDPLNESELASAYESAMADGLARRQLFTDYDSDEAYRTAVAETIIEGNDLQGCAECDVESCKQYWHCQNFIPGYAIHSHSGFYTA